jgi:tetratricopeptide (TPR) repeat protein
MPPSACPRSSSPRATGLALLAALALAPPSALPADERHGARPMLEPHTAALLVDYFDTFLRDQDIEGFRRSVQARYTEGTLARLATSGGTKARRAAVLALGLVGGFEVNEAVARRLRDDDPVVRELAVNALWAIWFRAGTPEQNAELERVRELIGRERPEEAIAAATRLVEQAPTFAEAFNQRAIARFHLGRYAESASDCRRVLVLNPYHIGALSGLGRCYLHLDRREEAIATFRRSLELQPHDAGLRQMISALESAED